MVYVSVVKISPSGRVEKFQEYATLEEADAHVARVIGKFPGAYTALSPGGGTQDWLCDHAAKTIAISPLPPTWAEIRSKRNGLLSQSDWRVLPDMPISAEWRAYRKALRDIPQTFSDPAAVVWPEAPRE